MNCILCHSANTIIIESILKDDLIYLYKRAFNINIEHIIVEDLDYHHCKDCDLRFFSLKNSIIPIGDNDFYNALNKISWYYVDEKHEYHYAKNFINKDSNVIEVGCGKGAFAKFIPNKSLYIGLEFSTDAKIMAAKNGIMIENVTIEDFATTHQNTFDVACSFQVLEHVANPHSFIKSQIECLKCNKYSSHKLTNWGGATR